MTASGENTVKYHMFYILVCGQNNNRCANIKDLHSSSTFLEKYIEYFFHNVFLKRNQHDSSRPMSVWSTSSVGLDSAGIAYSINGSKKKQHHHHHHPEPSSTIKLVHRPHNNKCRMSQSAEDLHTPRYLSWRKLHLSRAKLKASSKTSALLSGFAMVAMVELQLQNPENIPSAILIAFAIITTLLVAVHMLALMISTCILPNIEAICSLDAINLVDESPHERLHWYIETAWAFSTLLGLLLFLAEIAILCWVKFWEINKVAAWSASIILIPILFVFLAFAIHFYRSLVAHKYEMTVSGIRELEILKEQIEQGDHDHHHSGNGGGGSGRNGVRDLISNVHIV